MNKTLFKIINTLLSCILGILGFSSCDKGYMYGTPTSRYKASGIVTDKQGYPIEGARVVTYTEPEITYFYDTVFTDSKGKYISEGGSIGRPHILYVICDDPNDKYLPDSTTVTLNYKGGDKDWDLGTASVTVNFTLTHKN